MRTVEIRTYRLKPGFSEHFEAAMRDALALVRCSMDVVAFGRSDHEEPSYFLIRAFDSDAELSSRQEAFYSSSAWRDGPRESIVQCLDVYLNTVLEMSEQTVKALRSQHGKGLGPGWEPSP